MSFPSIFDEIKTPQMGYDWEVEFATTFGLPISDVIRFYATTVNIPLQSVENHKRYYAGRQYNVPLKDTSPNIATITFWDNEDLDIYTFFTVWHSLINHIDIDNVKISSVRRFLSSIGIGDGIDIVGMASSPREYTTDCNIYMLDGQGDRNKAHQLKECYVTEVGEATLSYTDTRVYEFDVRLAFNKRGLAL